MSPAPKTIKKNIKKCLTSRPCRVWWWSSDWRGSLGPAPDRRQGGWVDRPAQATFPPGALLIGTDHKVSAMCHLMRDCKQGQSDEGSQLPVTGPECDQQGGTEETETGDKKIPLVCSVTRAFKPYSSDHTVTLSLCQFCTGVG